MMETKDWITMIVPIFLDGVIVFCIQILIKKLIDNNKKDSIRTYVLSDFIKKLTFLKYKLSQVFHNSNYTRHSDMQDVLDYVNKLRMVYESNSYDLSCLSKEFKAFYDSWIKFVEVWNSAVGHTLLEAEKQNIYKQAQICEDATDALMKKIRKKY